MSTVDFEVFKRTFNDAILEKSKIDLLEKIADNPNRFVGLFRPTKPKAKILQNLLQSQEIRFGDALERMMEEYLRQLGYRLLDKALDYKGERLSMDLFFEKDGTKYFVEQKVRDDHDSTKKRGQAKNFETKLNVLVEKGYTNLKGYMFFVDPDAKKNYNYYRAEFDRMRLYEVPLKICYGEDFFKELGHPEVWSEILEYLKRWKKNLPDMPEINFDVSPEESYNEIREIAPRYIRKLIEDEELYQEIFRTIFPGEETLNLLIADFEQRNAAVYRNLARMLRDKLNGRKDSGLLPE